MKGKGLDMARQAAPMCLAVALFAGGAAVQTHAQTTQPAEYLCKQIDTIARALEIYQPLTNVQAAADTMLRTWAQSLDPLAAYWLRDEAAAWMAAEDGAIYEPGIEIAATNHAIVVVGLATNSHAAEVGLQVGDKIVSVDSAPTDGETVDRVRGWMQLAVDRPLVLGVADASGSVRNVSIEPIMGRKPAVAAAETLPTGLPYLKLNGFYPQSEANILSTLRRWVGQTNVYGLIIDLRDAAGRDVSSAAAVAAAFSSDGQTLAVFRSATDQDLAVFRAAPSFRIGCPVMLLTDHRTRGAAEWFAAVIKGLGHAAMLIGSETQGEPLVREPIELPWNRVLFAVTRHLVVADGTRYTGKEGVVPHIVVSPTETTAYEPPIKPGEIAKMTPQEQADRALRVRVGNDATLRRAVELLQALRALDVGSKSE